MAPRTPLRLIALTAALTGGCNLLFGISGGEPGGTGGAQTGTRATGTGGTGPGTSGTAGTGGTGTGGGVAAALSVTPSQTTLLARASLQLTATRGGSPASVTWKVLDANGGSVTQAGLYTAPATMGTYRVQATTVATPVQTKTATIDVVQMLAPVVISSTGELQTATGQGTQSHLVYAQGTAEWWLFHDDPSGPGSLATLFSSDFSTWHAGAAAALPQGHTGDGRDLSVAYAYLGGSHDVVHVSQGFGTSSYGRYHIRGALGASQIEWGQAQIVNPGGATEGGDYPPDGTSTIILPSGLVIDTTGYEYTPTLTLPAGLAGMCGKGDVIVYTSDVTDDGLKSFDSAKFSPEALWCVPGHTQARQLLQLGSFVILLYADGGTTTPMGGNSNVLMDYRDGSTSFWFPPEGGMTTTPPSVFALDLAMDIDDWTAAVQGGAVHVVRRVGGTFEHRVMIAPSTSPAAWKDGKIIPVQQTLGASGLFLAPYGAGLVLVAVSSDAGSILYTVFDGTAWSPWATLSFTTGGTSYLSGFAPASGPKPAVIWTQTAGASYAIAGLQLP